MIGRLGTMGIALACSLGIVVAVTAAPATSESARFAHATNRCTKYAELLSCYEALSLKPNNPELLVAEADALVQVKRPGEAIGVYRNALTLGARAESVNTRIGQAQSLRQSLLDTCFRQEGAFAERACESAWLPGAPDEIALFKRRGVLLEAEGRAGPALDAYLAAARLAPKDRAVAHAVVNLRESSGRRDAATLTAEGSAYLVLGRPKDAIAPLREAVRVAPGSTVAEERLRTAERAAALAQRVAQASRSTDAGTAVAAAPVPPPTVGTYSNDAEATRSN